MSEKNESFLPSCRHEPATEPDSVSPCARGNVPGDPGGGHTDPIDPDAPRSAHGRAETVGALPDAETCCGEPDQLPGRFDNKKHSQLGS